MTALFSRAAWALKWRWMLWRNNQRWKAAALQVAALFTPGTQQPVVFFNASTRLIGMSQNAAFSLLAAWGMRMRGVRVVHAVCQAGMHRCVLGSQREQPQIEPPCAGCVRQSRVVFAGAEVRWMKDRTEAALEQAVANLDLNEMSEFKYQGTPLGAITLPSLRWVLRRHHLQDNDATRFFFRQFIISAWSVMREFGELLDEVKPQRVVVFNGIAYPEGAAKWAAEQRGIPVVTHEVAHAPYTAFFTRGEATAYPIEVPVDFDLNPAQNARLDSYLEQRFQGKFSMAGIRFWPEMQSLGEEFWQQAAGFKQIVPVFTNVIFDTSQSHANLIFQDMFAWLDQVLEIARANSETLFVIRAHPDETRPGKESQESVADWVRQNCAGALENILFVPSDQRMSSYELIQRSKFVMVYNSTIGLEAVLLGAPVLSGGKSRYTQLPMVYFPATPQAHRAQAEAFLAAEMIEIPAEFVSNARRFLYFQLYRVALPFGNWLEEDGIWRGYVKLKDFVVKALDAPVFDTITNGLIENRAFELEEGENG